MIRLYTAFWLLLVIASGFALYAVKYQVQGLEDELARTRKASLADDSQIRVLTAEWAYLNRPGALADMNKRYLSLAPIATRQLRNSVADIPLRAPAPAPDVAAATAPPQAPAGAPPEVAAASAGPALPQATKPATVTAALRRPPRSLDELIARVVASR